jgi:hypothetical protein
MTERRRARESAETAKPAATTTTTTGTHLQPTPAVAAHTSAGQL